MSLGSEAGCGCRLHLPLPVPRRNTAAHRPQRRAEPYRLHLRFMCRQVIKSCNYERLLPRLAQPRALILRGNAQILHPLTAAPARGAGRDAQGRRSLRVRARSYTPAFPKPRPRTNGATGIPEHAKTPPVRSGTLSPGRSRRPRAQHRLRRDPRPGGGALPRAARHAGSRSPRPPHSAFRPSPAAPAPALRELGARWSLAPDPPPLPGALPGPQPPLSVPCSASAFRFLRAAPLGARSPAALFTTVPALSPRRTPAAGTGRCATAAA